MDEMQESMRWTKISSRVNPWSRVVVVKFMTLKHVKTWVFSPNQGHLVRFFTNVGGNISNYMTHDLPFLAANMSPKGYHFPQKTKGARA